jgi:hypothetical protein
LVTPHLIGLDNICNEMSTAQIAPKNNAFQGLPANFVAVSMKTALFHWAHGSSISCLPHPGLHILVGYRLFLVDTGQNWCLAPDLKKSPSLREVLLLGIKKALMLVEAELLGYSLGQSSGSTDVPPRQPHKCPPTRRATHPPTEGEKKGKVECLKAPGNTSPTLQPSSS